MKKSNDKMQSSVSFLKRGFSLYAIVAVSLMAVITGYFVLTNKSFMYFDIGSDTFFAFYPLQVAVAHQLHELHSISWSFQLGLGSFVGNLFDPAWLLTGWLPISWQIYLRLPIFLLKTFLAGGFIYGYLRRLGIAPNISVIGGLGYAFSSYGMINGQWGAIAGTEFVQLAAYLYLMELFLQSGNKWAAVAAGVAVGLGNAFGLYMFALVTLIYMFLHPFAHPGFEARATLRNYVRFGLFCIAGLLLTAPLLFPAVYYFLDSPRVSGSHSQAYFLLHHVFKLQNLDQIYSEIGGLLGKNFFGIGSHYKAWGNYLEGPAFYVGLLPLMCIPQLLAPSATRRERLLAISGVLFIVLYMLFPALQYVVYAFGHTGYRFSSLLVQTLILVMGCFGIRRMLATGLWVPGIIAGLFGISIIVLAAFWIQSSAVNHAYAISILVFTATYAVLLILASIQKSPIRHIDTALIVIMAIELSVLAIPSLTNRGIVSSEGSSPSGSYVDGTELGLAMIQAKEPAGAIYRTEKTYRSVFLDDSMVQGYRGTQSYYFHGTSITRFMQSMHIPFMFSTNYVQAPLNRPLVLDLLSVKYILSRDRNLDRQHNMTYLGSASNISVFKREGALSFARFADEIKSEAYANSLPQLARDQLLLHTVVVKNQLAASKRLSSLKVASPDATENLDSVQLRIANDNLLVGTVSASQPRVLVIAMPFDRGWSVFVGQSELSTFRADYGLTALVVPAGEHHLRLTYRPVGRRLGWWLSILTLFLLNAWPPVIRRLLHSQWRTATKSPK